MRAAAHYDGIIIRREREKERKRERERNREKEGIPEGGLKGFKEEVMNKDLHVWKGHTER